MVKLKLQYFGHMMQRTDSLEKTLILGGIGGRRRRGQQRMRCLYWHHQLDGHEFEQAPGAGSGLAFCSPWGRNESDMTEWLNWLTCSSAGKESTCNAAEPSSIPGLGRSPWEGISYPLQCSWASLVAQTVKNPLAMQETWVQSLDWEDLLEEGPATHSSIFAWRIPMDRGAWRATVRGVTKSLTQLSD